MWSSERPTEPGLYLFYGTEDGGALPKFMLVELRFGAEYVVDRRILDVVGMAGRWRPFDEKPPGEGRLWLRIPEIESQGRWNIVRNGPGKWHRVRRRDGSGRYIAACGRHFGYERGLTHPVYEFRDNEPEEVCRQCEQGRGRGHD